MGGPVPPAPLDRRVLRERIGTYALGVAIGCVLVGLLLQARYRMIERERRTEAAARSASPEPGGAPAQTPPVRTP